MDRHQHVLWRTVRVPMLHVTLELVVISLHVE
jgi:hypothetical protein